MYVLDTDHMSLLERGGLESDRIRARLRLLPPDDVATTIVSYEEQTRGWLAQISRFPAPERQIPLYAKLKRQLQNYSRVALLDFDEPAVEVFLRLQSAKLRLGTMDLKIASIAIANGAALVTRNFTDFSKAPGLSIEDWSV